MDFIMDTIEDYDRYESLEYEIFDNMINTFNSDSPDELEDVDPDYDLFDFLTQYDL